jgi:hypothetical protein
VRAAPRRIALRQPLEHHAQVGGAVGCDLALARGWAQRDGEKKPLELLQHGSCERIQLGVAPRLQLARKVSLGFGRSPPRRCHHALAAKAGRYRGQGRRQRGGVKRRPVAVGGHNGSKRKFFAFVERDGATPVRRCRLLGGCPRSQGRGVRKQRAVHFDNDGRGRVARRRHVAERRQQQDTRGVPLLAVNHKHVTGAVRPHGARDAPERVAWFIALGHFGGVAKQRAPLVARPAVAALKHGDAQLQLQQALDGHHAHGVGFGRADQIWIGESDLVLKQLGR